VAPLPRSRNRSIWAVGNNVRANNGKGSDATISRDQAIAHRQERAIASRHSLAELLHRVKEVDNQSPRRYF
jgi:hypothetical protein